MGAPVNHSETTDDRILGALKSHTIPTQQLAVDLNENAKRIYSRCRRLEEEGSLKSDLVRGKRLLYCVDHQQVVTPDIYDTCREDGHELRSFQIKERVWSLVSQNLRSD